MANDAALQSLEISGDDVLKEILGEYKRFHRTLNVRNPDKLLLINPPQVPEDMFSVEIARLKGYYAYPPVGLLYIAAVAYMVNPAIELRVIDLNFEMLKRCHNSAFRYNFWTDLLWRELKTAKSMHLGVTCMFGATKPIFTEIVMWIREEFPNLPILVGGVQASYDYQELLQKRHADIVFLREAEVSFRTFLHNCALTEIGNPVTPPRGIAFRVQDEVVEYTGRQVPSAADIDVDLRPFYSLLPIGDYYRYGSLAAFSRYNGEEKPFATVLSNRGCRARCTFCTVRDFNGFGVRQRDVQHVVDEIKFLVEAYGIKQIDWLDDDLLFNPSRALELFKALAKEVPHLEWICNNGLIGAATTEENMDWMVRSGIKALKIGIESGNDHWLRKIKKPTSKRKLLEAGRIFKRYPDVFISGNFIIGFPGEKVGEMLETFNFARQLGWDWASFYICQPLKGTEMFSVFQSLGDERCDYENYDKTLNPGRAAVRGEFGYYKAYHGEDNGLRVRSGREIFDLPHELVPSKDQIKEIWFTFNLVTNFLENPAWGPHGNIPKIIRWFESVVGAYPYDASMVAALAYGYKRFSDREKQKAYQKRFDSILKESLYWQRRVEQFPELLDFVR